MSHPIPRSQAVHQIKYFLDNFFRRLGVFALRNLSGFACFLPAHAFEGSLNTICASHISSSCYAEPRNVRETVVYRSVDLHQCFVRTSLAEKAEITCAQVSAGPFTS